MRGELTLTDTAERLSISKMTVLRLIADGHAEDGEQRAIASCHSKLRSGSAIRQEARNLAQAGFGA